MKKFVGLLVLVSLICGCASAEVFKDYDTLCTWASQETTAGYEVTPLVIAAALISDEGQVSVLHAENDIEGITCYYMADEMVILQSESYTIAVESPLCALSCMIMLMTLDESGIPVREVS